VAAAFADASCVGAAEFGGANSPMAGLLDMRQI